VVIAIVVIVVILALIALSFVVSNNRFVRQRNLVQESWRQIDVELQRRHDLIPNLIETVRGFATQERTVLQQVTEARTQAIQARAAGNAGPEQMAVAENQLQRSLGGLFAVAESYPQLKSNQNFLELQRQLADTEDRIAAGRRFYNGNVRAYNTRIEAFPSSLIASSKGYTKEQYFEVDDPQVRGPVNVDFSSLTSGGAPAQPAEAPAAPQQIPATQPQPDALPPAAPQQYGVPGQQPTPQQAVPPQGAPEQPAPPQQPYGEQPRQG
jgi:LemA protein